MIKLLIATEAPDEQSLETRFGGHPLVTSAKDFEWPTCASCDSEPFMQFLGQLVLPNERDEKQILLLFMCAVGDGCGTWEADSGANRALIETGTSFELCKPPVSDTTTLRECSYGAQIQLWPTGPYGETRFEWAKANGNQTRLVLGQYGGQPDWLHADETPICECGEVMKFVAQLEEGPDYKTAMNFGGGCAYVFRCGDHAAQFLFQC